MFSNTIYFIAVLAPSWARIGGKLRELDISPSDVVWGVNSEHSIYIRLGTRWEKVTGGLKHVSVGNAGVWGVNRFDHIYFREGITTSNLPGTKWTRISGENILRNILSREKMSNFDIQYFRYPVSAMLIKEVFIVLIKLFRRHA